MDEDGLKKAYKKASLKNHPDKGATSRLQSHEARYGVLDANARKRYDVMGIDLGDEEGGGDPADEIYTAGKPIFQEIGQACVKTAIGGAFVVLACRWRWARALLWLASVALLVVLPAKGRQRALFGALLLGVNLVILAGTYVALVARARGVRVVLRARLRRRAPPRRRQGRRPGLVAEGARDQGRGLGPARVVAPRAYGVTRRARVRAADPRHAHLLRWQAPSRRRSSSRRSASMRAS